MRFDTFTLLFRLHNFNLLRTVIETFDVLRKQAQMEIASAQDVNLLIIALGIYRLEKIGAAHCMIVLQLEFEGSARGELTVAALLGRRAAADPTARKHLDLVIAAARTGSGQKQT